MSKKAYFHLPGLFEFYELYKIFLPIFHEHKEYFYEWIDIASIYGAPSDCLWGGGRACYGDDNPNEVFKLLSKYNISARLTFSNSLLEEKHLSDKKCNRLCELLNDSEHLQNGVIIYSDLLLDYLKNKYPKLYYVSSTTKVITDFDELKKELSRDDFKYVVPDFRLNKAFDSLKSLSDAEKDKLEFLCNECCYIGCQDRKKCYESVSHKSLGDDYPEHICESPKAGEGYKFSSAMKNPAFIGINDIRDTYLPLGFSNFKIEGRGLGSAIVLEMLLYYLVKPEYRLIIRESIYLDSYLDLF